MFHICTSSHFNWIFIITFHVAHVVLKTKKNNTFPLAGWLNFILKKNSIRSLLSYTSKTNNSHNNNHLRIFLDHFIELIEVKSFNVIENLSLHVKNWSVKWKCDIERQQIRWNNFNLSSKTCMCEHGKMQWIICWSVWLQDFIGINIRHIVQGLSLSYTWINKNNTHKYKKRQIKLKQ